MTDPSVSSVEVRLVRPEDAAALTGLVLRSREALAPWEPLHPAEFFTERGQRSGLVQALARQARDEQHP
ncbi:MAG: hypothetical protein ACRYG2_38325, partial [Janthinobacterium lividum]